VIKVQKIVSQNQKKRLLKIKNGACGIWIHDNYVFSVVLSQA